MFKCIVFVLCAVTIVFCAPGYENLRESEKQSSRQEQVTDRLNDASRTKRQSLGKVDIVYLNAESIDPSKLKDLQSKELSRLAPVDDVTNPGHNFQELSDTNLEIVSQNSNNIEYKLNSTDDSPLNSLSDDKGVQGSDNQYYNNDTGQYSENKDIKHLSLLPLPSIEFPPLHFHHYPTPPPPNHYPPPPHHHQSPPPPQVTDKTPANNVESDKNQQQLVEVTPPTKAPAYPIFQAVAVTPEE